MEHINTHFNETIRLNNTAGYAKIGTVHFSSATNITGIPNYISCGFNLDVTCCGNLYKTGKPFSGRFFVYIKGNDSNPTQIDVYYDNKDLLNTQNNTGYDISTDMIQFVANYTVLDSSSTLPVATCDIDIYLKSDAVIVLGYNVSNFTYNSAVSYENNLLARRDIVTTIPTGNVSLTVNQYNKVNYRNIYTPKTTANGFTSTELVYVTDPINHKISCFGRVTLKAGFAVGGTLDYVTALSSKYAPLTEIHFPVTVFYNITGNPIGTGDVKITTGSVMNFVGYDRMDTQPITAISQISLTGITWEY